MRRVLVGLGVVLTMGLRVGGAQESASAKMADTVMKAWPAGLVSTENNPGKWAYEEGVLLDGLAAEWHTTADGREFKYIKAAVDKYVSADGEIKGYSVEAHSLDNIEMGRAVMLVYRVTQQERYYKAAKFIHEQLAVQPRTASGGYWHKQIYPNQMWLDGAYMAGPFRAAYAATFQERGDFDDIAKELLLMDGKMRDPKTGLLKHGWDESKQMAWADKTTGLSPELWARAIGWYAMALVDVLDWFPKDHPERAKLVAALNRTAAAIVQYQDKQTGLWWQVMDKAGKAGNYPEASASCMFVYALAKGARMGYLPIADEAVAKRGWEGVQKRFVTADADGAVTLHGTVKVGGLGGSPYRSGTYEYYIGEKIIDQDAKGVGAYLLAGSEMEQSATAGMARGKVVMVDAWFNSQTRKNAAGQTELFHYKWDDDTNNGFAFFGRAFQRYGAELEEETVAPGTAEGATRLKKAQVFIMASPDIPIKNPKPNYMDKASGDAIEAWVKAGGVLLLMQNDGPNAEFEHFNTLTDRFGIHFNAVLRNHVVNDDFPAGTLMIPAGTGVFAQPHKAYLKDTSTITVSGPAKAVLTATTEPKSDVMMAVAKVGKGTVYAVVDPWLYNEYVDRRNNLPLDYDGFAAAVDLAGWTLRQSR
ncbi:glycoside hydrolase family 88 protein [Granulicella sp. dw_53]|uniref:glycoside hydrolase family 88/105 protein n=1 Tax=Granulicella sp. dw_53 TaxID=2719792 RepID=UPI001BD30ECB|nr:glycoside hydrolase family 88 protein [Granulicella sp. dw_53]